MLKEWKLCFALWGPVVNAYDDGGAHGEVMAWKNALSHWLEEATSETHVIVLVILN